MKTLITSLIFGLFLSLPLLASGSGSSSKPLQNSYPIVLSHGLFGWGDSDSKAVVSIIDYWGGLDEYLRSQGAVVYAPTKSATQSNEIRGQQLKEKVLVWMAAKGVKKVHVIGHSQGGLDSRYMISNLGMSTYVSSLTTVSTPHYGSPIADIVKAVLPDWIEPFVSKVLGVVTKLIWSGTDQDGIAALESLTKEGLSAFNSYTPNSSGVKYFSTGSHITITDIVQHPLMGILHPICGLGGSSGGQGFANDGLVPLSSQKWGTWLGEPNWNWFATGLDHLQMSNTFKSGEWSFDVEGYYLFMAKNAMNKQ
ncbi:MAG: lipase [Leptospiraceae bacterium]|nr:lipase [Leptospiraceae bacterium]